MFRHQLGECVPSNWGAAGQRLCRLVYKINAKLFSIQNNFTPFHKICLTPWDSVPLGPLRFIRPSKFRGVSVGGEICVGNGSDQKSPFQILENDVFEGVYLQKIFSNPTFEGKVIAGNGADVVPLGCYVSFGGRPLPKISEAPVSRTLCWDHVFRTK